MLFHSLALNYNIILLLQGLLYHSKLFLNVGTFVFCVLSLSNIWATIFGSFILILGVIPRFSATIVECLATIIDKFGGNFCVSGWRCSQWFRGRHYEQCNRLKWAKWPNKKWKHQKIRMKNAASVWPQACNPPTLCKLYTKSNFKMCKHHFVGLQNCTKMATL